MNQIITMGLIFILVLSNLSCVSTTTIKALDKNGKIDKDVKIYVEGKQIGQGEAKYFDTKTVYSSVPYLELKKEGCKSQRQKLDTQTNLISSIGGGLITGLGIGLMQAGIQGSIQKTTSAIGIPISLLGLLPLFWTRQYTPAQEQEFQCVKIDNVS